MLTQARHEIGRDSYLRSRLVQCSLGGDLIMTGNAAHWFVDRHIAEGRGNLRLRKLGTAGGS